MDNLVDGLLCVIRLWNENQVFFQRSYVAKSSYLYVGFTLYHRVFLFLHDGGKSSRDSCFSLSSGHIA